MTEKPNLTDVTVEKMQEVFTDMLNQQAGDIAQDLRTADDGKLTINAVFKLTIVKDMEYVQGTLSRSKKFTTEAEACGEVPDPTQPRLDLK